MKVVNTLDFPYAMPRNLFGGRVIVIPNDKQVHEIPDYDYKNNTMRGIVVVEPPVEVVKVEIITETKIEPPKIETSVEVVKVELITETQIQMPQIETINESVVVESIVVDPIKEPTVVVKKEKVKKSVKKKKNNIAGRGKPLGKIVLDPSTRKSLRKTNKKVDN